MIRVILLILLNGCFLSQVAAQALAGGKLVRMLNFPSREIEPREVDVWLPEGYSPQQRYPVLYMHDGQMLFDSTGTWNHQEWGVDEAATQLIREKKVKPFMVVAIWNIPEIRHLDYFPQKAWEALNEEEQGRLKSAHSDARTTSFFQKGPRSDAYLRFLVNELKPYIDSLYPTLRGPEHTAIAGSSMGGLISLYAWCEYPQVFGKAACLSTHWPGIFTLENNPIPTGLMRYLSQKIPPPRKNRIWFDHGTSTLDALYPGLQQEADSLMKAKGYTAKLWKTKVYPNADHSEKAWRLRLPEVLFFLMKK